ncbi:general substrate transporter [Mucor lusitanicus]|uniref:General substrate transporter n=1 Tax=Mucor circinelloides f. lusitanicus TaxID=29924 RepID=A0A8H4EZK9_MUCCL|nr:general substrate transporter [Mucor lusitanicus]
MLIAPSFQTYFHIDPNNKIQEAEINGNIVSVLQVGCLFGSLLATSTADALGRKYSIMTAAFVFTIGGIFQIIGYNLMILYLGRVISGLGVGALSMLVPIYVAEIAHQRHRGLLGGLWMFFIATGLASSYWSNYIVRILIDQHDNMLWRIPLIIQVVPSIMLLFGMAWLFETPRWLCAHNRSEEALQVLCKIRGSEDVKEEMEQIQSSLSVQAKNTSWKQVISVPHRKRLLLGISIQALQQMTGTNVINYFSPIIFKSIGLSSNEAELLATGVYGILKMIVVLIGFSSLIDRFGRRPLLIGGGVAMGMCMYAVSVCVALNPINKTPQGMDVSSISATAALGIVFMYSYAVFFALSWGPCPWLYCSEIYPMSTRAKSTSLTTAVNWIFNAVIGKVSPIMLATNTIGTYIFFGSWCIAASVFCFGFLPETKGKTLEEINSLF